MLRTYYDTIDHIAVSDRADVSVMGSKTSVYAVMHNYDVVANVIYYSAGSDYGSSVNLHDMFFDGDAGQYQSEMDKFKTDSNQFGSGKANSNGGNAKRQGVHLYVYDSEHQEGNGILLKNFRGQKTYFQRFSTENLTQRLDSERGQDFFNSYFDTGLEFYQSNNLYEILSPDINHSQEFGFGNLVRLTTVFDEGEIVVEESGIAVRKSGDKKKRKYQF